MSTARLLYSFEIEHLSDMSDAIAQGDLAWFKSLTLPPHDLYLHVPFGILHETAAERAIYARQKDILHYLIYDTGVDVCCPLVPSTAAGMLTAPQIAQRCLTIFNESPSLHSDKQRRRRLEEIVALLSKAAEKQHQDALQARMQARFIWSHHAQHTEGIVADKSLPIDASSARFAVTTTLLLSTLRHYEFSKNRRIFHHTLPDNRRAFIAALRSLVAYLGDPLHLQEHTVDIVVGAMLIVRDLVEDMQANRALGSRRKSTFVEALQTLLLRLGVQLQDEKAFKRCFHDAFGPLPELSLFL